MKVLLIRSLQVFFDGFHQLWIALVDVAENVDDV